MNLPPSKQTEFCAAAYRVSLRKGERGQLLWLSHSGVKVARPLFRGKRCWEYLARRTEPCPGCPLGSTTHPGDGAAGVVTTDGQYAVIRMNRRGAAADVTVRCLSAQELGLVNAARVRQLLAGFRLSPRESAVLHLILKGHQVKEIASQLELSPRTVKFHGRNLLRKLGVETRLELFGILLGFSPARSPPRHRGPA